MMKNLSLVFAAGAALYLQGCGSSKDCKKAIKSGASAEDQKKCAQCIIDHGPSTNGMQWTQAIKNWSTSDWDKVAKKCGADSKSISNLFEDKTVITKVAPCSTIVMGSNTRSALANDKNLDKDQKTAAQTCTDCMLDVNKKHGEDWKANAEKWNAKQWKNATEKCGGSVTQLAKFFDLTLEVTMTKPCAHDSKSYKDSHSDEYDQCQKCIWNQAQSQRPIATNWIGNTAQNFSPDTWKDILSKCGGKDKNTVLTNMHWATTPAGF